MSYTPYEIVKLARDNSRPTGLDYIRHIFSGFIEFHGDRRFADDPAVVGGIAWLDNSPVRVIPQRSVPSAISVLLIRRDTANPFAL